MSLGLSGQLLRRTRGLQGQEEGEEGEGRLSEKGRVWGQAVSSCGLHWENTVLSEARQGAGHRHVGWGGISSSSWGLASLLCKPLPLWGCHSYPVFPWARQGFQGSPRQVGDPWRSEVCRTFPRPEHRVGPAMKSQLEPPGIPRGMLLAAAASSGLVLSSNRFHSMTWAPQSQGTSTARLGPGPHGVPCWGWAGFGRTCFSRKLFSICQLLPHPLGVTTDTCLPQDRLATPIP